MDLKTIQQNVGLWSLENFGQQQSKVDPDLFLGSLAPLMGIAEEIGELASAQYVEEVEDALGDIAIYLCDYAARENFQLQPLWPDNIIPATQDVSVLMKPLGELFHCTLKRHQGIRGFDMFPTYVKARDKAVQDLLKAMVAVASGHGFSLPATIQSTWELVVAERDWKKNPQGPEEQK